MGTLGLRFTDEQLPDLKTLVDRGLNCWDPKEAPSWAFELADVIDRKITQVAAKKDHGETDAGDSNG